MDRPEGRLVGEFKIGLWEFIENSPILAEIGCHVEV